MEKNIFQELFFWRIKCIDLKYYIYNIPTFFVFVRDWHNFYFFSFFVRLFYVSFSVVSCFFCFCNVLYFFLFLCYKIFLLFFSLYLMSNVFVVSTLSVSLLFIVRGMSCKVGFMVSLLVSLFEKFLLLFYFNIFVCLSLDKVNRLIVTNDFFSMFCCNLKYNLKTN